MNLSDYKHSIEEPIRRAIAEGCIVRCAKLDGRYVIQLELGGKGAVIEVPAVDAPKRKPEAVIKGMGYSGAICPTCHGARMVRRGPCHFCEDCGSATGGCG